VRFGPVPRTSHPMVCGGRRSRSRTAVASTCCVEATASVLDKKWDCPVQQQESGANQHAHSQTLGASSRAGWSANLLSPGGQFHLPNSASKGVPDCPTRSAGTLTVGPAAASDISDTWTRDAALELSAALLPPHRQGGCTLHSCAPSPIGKVAFKTAQSVSARSPCMRSCWSCVLTRLADHHTAWPLTKCEGMARRERNRNAN